MSSSANPLGDPRARPARPRRSVAVVGCLGVLLAGGLLAAAALAVVRPYRRASAYLTTLARESLPPAAEVAPVAVSFPARVDIAELALPAVPEHAVPALTLHRLTGSTTLLSWLRRRPALTVSSQIWGGTLQFAGELAEPAGALTRDDLPPVRVQADARDIRLEDLSLWLGMPDVWRGRGLVEVAGLIEPTFPRASVLSGSLSGQDWYVPELDFGDVVLPPNRRATVLGEAVYRDEVLEVQVFRVAGSGYELEAHVRVLLQEPVERSPIRGQASLRLKERAVWRRPTVSEDYADAMMQLLIASGGRIHARLEGTLGDPAARLDEADTITSILRGQ